MLAALAMLSAVAAAGASGAVAGQGDPDDLTVGAEVSAARVSKPTREVVRRVRIIDGDTFVARRPGSKREIIVRNAGIQAMEDRECGKKPAKQLLSRLLGKKVVIVSRTNQARPNGLGIWRIQRNAFTPSGRDIQSAMLRSGLVLPYGIGRETLKQDVYATLAQQAARAGKGLFSGTYCRSGPVQESPLQLMINYDASGRDRDNLGGKFVRIRNLGDYAVPIGRWRLRAAAHDSFYFPAGAILPAHGEVMVRLGNGIDTATTFYWEGDRVRFFVPGHSRYQGGGGYLFDRDGDIRAWSMYPCRVLCGHPAIGLLKGNVSRGDTDQTPSPSSTRGSGSATPSGSSSTSPSTGSPSSSAKSSPSGSPGALSASPSASGSPSSSVSTSSSSSPSQSPSESATPTTGPDDPDRTRERVWFTNTSDREADLSYTVAMVRDQIYEFPLGTVVEPGERLTLFTGMGETTRLRHFLGLGEPFLFADPTGATAKIRTHDSVRIACVAWGAKSC